MLKLFYGVVPALLICLSSFGSQEQKPVTLEMQVELNGKVVSHPRMVVGLGEKGRITQEIDGSGTYSIEVQPAQAQADSVRLNFVVRQSDGDESRVLSRPRVVVMNGESAIIEQRPDSHTSLKLRVTPTF